MDVTITGLPVGWAARATECGTIVFRHMESGHEQAEVPPGFAQLAASRMDAASVPASDEMTDAAPSTAAPPAEPSQPAQQGWMGRVSCDGCERKVSGTRYQCLTRINFDLCEACMWSPTCDLRRGHQWLKMQFIAAA